ncbi:MAG: hypothetical protein HY921_03600 [Elusimicrobia bacterium]|nr:hypothetical protein [Elusimicrobiota bacterium]
MSKSYFFGEWRKGGEPLTAEEAAELCRKAADLRQAVGRYPLDKVLRLLSNVRDRWRDPSYPRRLKMERELPALTGFSPDMVRLGLDELCWAFDPEVLRRKMDAELGGTRDGTLSWRPLGVLLHVLAGNVFVGAAGSLVEGLITRNVNVLKMSSSETAFLPELVESLVECDEEGFLSKALAVVQYSSAQADVIAEFKRSVDGIVVWGGEEAVRGYRDGLPARTKLILYGPKLSAAVCTSRGLEADLEGAARKLAREMSIWDQNACTAPQACYVQGLTGARKLAEALPRALEEEAKILPPGGLELNQAAEIRKIRGVAEIAEARGEGLLKESPQGLDWTVVLDQDQALDPSPLHRTLRIIVFRGLPEVLDRLAELRGYVQTVGLACAEDESAELCRALEDVGVLRMLPLGEMSQGEVEDPHDGSRALPQFMRLVIRRPRLKAPEPFERLSREEGRELINERLRILLDHARRSPFYARRLTGLEIDSLEDLPKIPVLTRHEMEAGMPPQGEALATGRWRGGYVTRSGGSTGVPKFSVYDGPDWERLVSHAAGIFRALGLEPRDRLANFMLAGDLYGSFVSFDHINARLGLATFAFAGSSEPKIFAEVWRKFSINAAQGIPSQLIPFLRQAKALEPALALEKVVYGGSSLAPSDREWLERELKVRRISSVIGANDGGQFAFQCEFQRGGLHHSVDDFNYLEVADPEGRPVPEGETGQILITSLLKHAYPLIRYAVGDQARMTIEPCPCGRRARVLEYLGRADDIVVVGMMNLRFRDMAEALRDFPVSALQLSARNDGGGEWVTIRAESSESGPALAGRMREALLGRVEKLKERLAEGFLKDVRVELHRPGSLARNARSGKIKEILDERA